MRQYLPVMVLPMLAACGLFERPTPGELGVAKFAYHEGLFGCAFGCDADEPLALDAQATVMVVNGDDLGPFHVRSDDPAVLGVTEVEGGEEGWPSAFVSGLADGDAGLVVEDPDGELIDVLSMQVRTVDAIEIDSPDLQARLLLTEGERIGVHLDLLSDEGDELAGVGAVEWALADDQAAGGEPVVLELPDYISEQISDFFVGSTRERATVEAGSTGASAVLEAGVATGARLALPVEVVEPSVIAEIDLVVPNRPRAGETFRVEAHGYTADGERVYIPACEWTVDPGRTRAEEVSSDGGRTTWEPERLGRLKFTCTQGDLVATRKVWVIE